MPFMFVVVYYQGTLCLSDLVLVHIKTIESKKLGKLFHIPCSNAEGLTEDKLAVRYIPSKHLSICPGQRIFPVRYSMYIFHQKLPHCMIICRSGEYISLCYQRRSPHPEPLPFCRAKMAVQYKVLCRTTLCPTQYYAENSVNNLLI